MVVPSGTVHPGLTLASFLIVTLSPMVTPSRLVELGRRVPTAACLLMEQFLPVVTQLPIRAFGCTLQSGCMVDVSGICSFL